jgi:3D (Asp-Asp-Asp) domain-containing protein
MNVARTTRHSTLRSILLALTTALAACVESDAAPIRMPPVLVQSPLRVPGAIVQGASKRWYLAAYSPPRYGDPVPVEITAYCLTRTQTRRGRYVRAGIVATDPKLFPLSRYVELYVGNRYMGRFLIDDTGLKIKGNKIDIWMPTCREARIFGRRKGTAVLVPREPTITLAGKPRTP